MTSNEERRPDLSGQPSAPQTRPEGQADSRRFPWKTLVALIVLGVIGAVVWQRRSHSAADTKSAASARGGAGPVTVVVGTVSQKDVPIYLDGLGTVQAFNAVTVRSRVDGQLVKLAFRDGQDVKAGDLLAQIDPAPFQTQLDQVKAKRAQDEAQLENARIELKRDGELLASKILSQEVYDAQKAQVNQLAAAVNADQAAIASAQVQLNYCTIRAPIDGRTGIRFVDEGNIIHSSESNGIVMLTQLRPISVVFTLPEQSLRGIQEQMGEDEMSVQVVDRDNRTVLDQGKLAVIDNQIDTSTGTIRLKATCPNQDLKLWPGQFANARLLLTMRKGGIVVPASVIQRGPEGPYAFVVQPDMTVKMSPVKVAQIDRGEALLDSGLSPGERVVVDGQYKLQPGSKIKQAGEDPNSNSQAPEKSQGPNSKGRERAGG